MASMLALSQSHSFSTIKLPNRVPKFTTGLFSFLCLKESSSLSSQVSLSSTPTGRKHLTAVLAAAAIMAEEPKKQSEGGFLDEMRLVAVKLHSRDQVKGGEKEPDTPPIAQWELCINGYLHYIVNLKLVYNTLEAIVLKASHPSYAEFRNTGLERPDALKKDLEWFKEQGHSIPEPADLAISYTHYLEELSEKDHPAFICHLYNDYFAHTAGGQRVLLGAEKICSGQGVM